MLGLCQRLTGPLRAHVRRRDEYEEQIAGMHMVIRIAVRRLQVLQDSDIVIGENQLMKGRMLDGGIGFGRRSVCSHC